MKPTNAHWNIEGTELSAQIHRPRKLIRLYAMRDMRSIRRGLLLAIEVLGVIGGRGVPTGITVEVYFELPSGVAVETHAEVVRSDGNVIGIAGLVVRCGRLGEEDHSALKKVEQ